MVEDKKIQFSFYPVDLETRAGGPEYKFTGLITRDATNYIDIFTEDGSITLSFFRDFATGQFQMAVTIVKDGKTEEDSKERRVYRGNLFDEPFERDGLTDAEKHELEEERKAMGSPRIPRPLLPPPAERFAPVEMDNAPPTFENGGEEEGEIP